MPEKRIGGDWNWGDGGMPILGAQSSASAAIASNGQYSPLIIEENGGLKVNASVSLGANQSVNVNQIGGVSVATGGSGIQSVAIQSNSTIDVSRIGGSTAATAGAGILSVGLNSAGNSVNISQIGGQTLATGGTGIQSVDIKLGGTTIATGGAGVPSFNQQLLAGQTIATGGTGRQLVSSDIFQVGAVTVATAGAGILKVGADLFQVGGSATVTASAGVQRTQSVTVLETQQMFSSGLAKKPVFLQISASASGSNVLVASAASTQYRILAYNLMANGAVNAQFLSSATPMGGIVYCPTAGVGKVAPFCPVGWMETTAGHSLNLNLSANIAVGGEIVYLAI